MARKPLSKTHPALAAEWHPTLNGTLTPDNFYVDNRAQGKLRIWWLGECGHTWWAQIGARTLGRGCGFCRESKDPEMIMDI